MNRWLAPLLLVVVAAVAVVALSRPSTFRLAENPPAAQNKNVSNPPTGSKADVNAQWKASAHSRVTPSKEPPSKRDTCVICHSGAGFAKQTTKAAEAPSQPIGCNDCHNFGGNTPGKLRIVGTSTLPNGRKIADSKSATCMTCHNSRRNIGDPKTLSGASAPHYSPQTEVYYGTNAYELAGAKYSNSVHTGIPNPCVTCHMAPAPGENVNNLGGHSMYIARGEIGKADRKVNMNACTPCHPGLATLDRPAYGDFDGNGIYAGIQTEVTGLMHLVETEVVKAAGAAKLGHEGGKIVFTDSAGKAMANVDPKYLRAAWNFMLIELDGSRGVHNPVFAVQVLQATYRDLTGKAVPGATLRTTSAGA